MDPGASRIDLHAHLHGILQEWLAQPLRDVFDELDTRLFSLAEHSRSGTQQHLYFDALRHLRTTRVDVEIRFLQSADEALQPGPDTDLRARPRGALQLLDKDEQEETLQLEQQIQRLSERVVPALTALLARLSELAGHAPPQDSLASAISPRGLSRAFRNALAQVDVSIEIRLIALGLFGHHVLAVVEPLYAQLNARLRDADILPELQESAPPARPRGFVPAPRRVPQRLPDDEAATGGPATDDAPDTQPDGNDERIGELNRLITLGRQAAMAPDGAPLEDTVDTRPHGPLLSVAMLDSALDELWTYDGEPLGFKPELLVKARALAHVGDGSLALDDEDVIDMIGLLFARIHDDSDLPAPMRKLLARLHVPFLRTALREPMLLHGAIHPARELLDELGDLAIGWCNSSDPNGDLLKQVALTVEQLAAHREGVQSVEYARAIEILKGQMETHARRAELAEHRTIETIIGRERLELARSRVVALVQQRLRQHEPMPWVRQLLRGPWAHHLALVWLRQSESSAAFRKSLEFVDELLWVDEPRSGPQDANRLAKAREALPAQLRQGLAGVNLHDSEIEDLVLRLEDYLEAQLHGTEPADYLYENDPTLVQTDFAAQWKESIVEDQPTAAPIDPVLVAKLRTLRPGTWFEFRLSQQDEVERAKFCWTSPYTGHYLFVNRNGTRVREMAAADLTTEMEAGLSRMIDANRLLERSLRALIDQLRENFTSLDLARSG